MSLTFYPNPGKPRADEQVNSVVIVRGLVIPTFESLQSLGTPQFGSIAYIKSLQTLFIGGAGAWIPIQAQTSNIALTPGAIGDSIIFNGVGPNLSFKRLNGGSGVSITSSSGDITVEIVEPPYTAGLGISIVSGIASNTLPGVVYTAGTGLNFAGNVLNSTGVDSVTSGDTVVSVTGTQNNRSVSLGYVAGTNISIAGNVISSTLPLGVDTVSAGNTTIVIGGTASNPTVKCNYAAGTGISITGTNIINSTLSPIVLSVVAGDSTVTIGGTASVPIISGNYQGAGQISIVGNVVSSTNYVTSVTAGNSTIVIGGSASIPSVSSGYVAGNEITIVGNTISVVPSTVVTITAANNTMIVNNVSTNNLLSGNYQAGTGVSIVGNVISVPIQHMLSLTAADATMTIGGTATNPTVTGNYQAGGGIIITGNVISSGSTVLKSYSFTTGTGSIAVNALSTAVYLLSKSRAIQPISVTFTTLQGTGIMIMEPLIITGMQTSQVASNSSSLTVIKTYELLINGIVTPAAITFPVGNYDSFQVSTGLSVYIPQYSVIQLRVTLTNTGGSTATIYQALAAIDASVSSTTSIVTPPEVSGVSATSTTSSITLSWTLAGGTAIGHRIIYKTGPTAPTSWTDPTGTQIFESAIIGNSRVISTLASATQYSFRIITINGNTPQTMSTGVTFTFSTV
jgi:hypothetical protein